MAPVRISSITFFSSLLKFLKSTKPVIVASDFGLNLYRIHVYLIYNLYAVFGGNNTSRFLYIDKPHFNF